MDISVEWFNDNSGFMTFIAAMVALLVGIIAAGISIWNTLITHRGLRLQYQPDLQIKTGQKQGIYFIHIENIGSGTAYVIKYNQDFVNFIRQWTDQKGEMIGLDSVDSLSLGSLQSGEFKEYTITPQYMPEPPNEPIQLEIKVSYTDIFRKFKGETNTICFIA